MRCGGKLCSDDHSESRPVTARPAHRGVLRVPPPRHHPAHRTPWASAACSHSVNAVRLPPESRPDLLVQASPTSPPVNSRRPDLLVLPLLHRPARSPPSMHAPRPRHRQLNRSPTTAAPQPCLQPAAATGAHSRRRRHPSRTAAAAASRRQRHRQPHRNACGVVGRVGRHRRHHTAAAQRQCARGEAQQREGEELRGGEDGAGSGCRYR